MEDLKEEKISKKYISSTPKSLEKSEGIVKKKDEKKKVLSDNELIKAERSQMGIDIEEGADVYDVNLMKEEFESFEYELPDFDVLAEDFDVEKAYEKDSSFLLREVRKVVTEKMTAYLQLFETFMNPGSTPMFVFSVLRGLTEKDKEFVKISYKKLSKYQLASVKLDTVYDEAKEAEFILKAANEWQDMKQDIYDLIERLEGYGDEELEASSGGYYN